MGVVSFTPGKDGGKDGKFTGQANKYPSEVKFWNGKFIIQAKHTSTLLLPVLTLSLQVLLI